MMVQTQKSDLISAFILLRCSKSNHDDCRKIRDALIDQVGNVQEAYTTNATVDGVNWCVAASALVDVKDNKKFEDKLWGVHAEGKTPITVDDIRLFLDNQ